MSGFVVIDGLAEHLRVAPGPCFGEERPIALDGDETRELPLNQVGTIEYGHCKGMEVTEDIGQARFAAERAAQIPS